MEPLTLSILCVALYGFFTFGQTAIADDPDQVFKQTSKTILWLKLLALCGLACFSAFAPASSILI